MVGHRNAIRLHRTIIGSGIGSGIAAGCIQNKRARNYAIVPPVVAGQVATQRNWCAGTKRTCRATGNCEIGYYSILD